MKSSASRFAFLSGSAARRRVLACGLAALLAFGGGAAAWAQPAPGRMDPAEREQLRRDLRQRSAEGARRNDLAPRFAPPPDAHERGQRMSPEEREQLRRQLREARGGERNGRRRD
ncbi:MAG: hypothetical protein J0H09_06500 [Burkholderiales bacterium]|nr:hypothetical protein [Burkholderiales bacterium]